MLETMLGELKSRIERISSDLISKDSVVPQQLKKKWVGLVLPLGGCRSNG